jgi:nucleotide-binding universal stress UspA family protein
LGITRIVNPVDFSTASREALDIAIELARALGAKLEIIHAIEVLTYRGVEYREVMSPDSCEEERAEAQAQVDEWTHVAKEAGVETEGQVIRGDARHAIVEYARKSDADLIVIAAKGHSRLHTLLMGSVSIEVARSAPCSVHIVR